MTKREELLKRINQLSKRLVKELDSGYWKDHKLIRIQCALLAAYDAGQWDRAIKESKRKSETIR